MPAPEPPRRRRTRVAVATALAVAVALAWATAGGGAAAAQEAPTTRAEAAELAREAVTDDAALERLRAVDELDGQPVDLGAATAGVDADDATRAEALRALARELDGGEAADVAPDAPDPADSRDAARRVLDDEKFDEDQVPRPFKGVLEWLADRLRPLGRAIERIVSPILDLPGGPFILLVLIVAAGAAGASWLAGRRSRAAVDRPGGGGVVDPALDPTDLERRADAAEAQGDLVAAIRLRHQAGLLRLAATDRLTLRADTTASGAARQVGDPALDRVTATFEAVVYGDEVPDPATVATCRADWTEVLGVGSRR